MTTSWKASFRLAMLCVSTWLVAAPCGAQTWPDRPIRVIVPFAAGGGVDNVARIVTRYLGPRLQQPIIIDNRRGANANIGSEAVAKSPPDGYTLLMGATYLAFNRATMKNLSYDSLTDLVPVARAGRAPFMLVVSSQLPVTTVSELVAWMKAHPAESAYGAVGAGAPTTLIFVKNTKTDPVQVLYKGGAEALPDLMTGRLTFMIQTVGEVLPLVTSGKLRALAVTGNERLNVLPDVPTMAQAGVKDLNEVGWWGLFVPARTPAPVIARVSSEMQAVMKMPEVVAALEKLGIQPGSMPAAEFGAFYRDEISRMADVARQFNLVVE